MTLPLHPACRLFPPLPGEELDRLAADIAARGLLHPIVLHEGAVLDGRNRLEACRRAGVAPRFATWDGAGSPLEWVIAQNVVRRHLSASQRAVLALAVLPLMEADAKERQRMTPGAGKKVAQICATLPQGGEPSSGKASDVAAHLVAASPRYVQAAKRIQQTCPDLLAWVAEGRISLHVAEQAARLDRTTRTRVLAMLSEAPAAEDFSLRRLIAAARQRNDNPYASRALLPSPSEDPPLLLLPAPTAATAHEFQIRLTPAQLDSLDHGLEIAVELGNRACVLRKQVDTPPRQPR